MKHSMNGEEMKLLRESELYMKTLCRDIPGRCVGSEGNREATRFFERVVRTHNWQVELQEFEAIDWEEQGATLQLGERSFEVLVGPYSLGCDVREELIPVSSIDELEKADIRGKIVFLHGDIAKEQIMPKNFIFYNPEEHKRIIAALEKGAPLAVIGATGRNSGVAGGVYPFPLIEDGDFDVPFAYMTDVEGEQLLRFAGREAALISRSRRIPGMGWNVIARKGTGTKDRIVVSAHIDAKKGTPGAIDNATGVTILILLAELLRSYEGEPPIELAAFNGEDYYAVPGQMLYIERMDGRFDEVALNINIDGAGYKEGRSAFSFYGLPAEMEHKVRNVMAGYDGIVEGVQWVQGDHSMFVQNGSPAIAVTSNWFSENMDDQKVTHTPADNLEIVDYTKLVEIAKALSEFIL